MRQWAVSDKAVSSGGVDGNETGKTESVPMGTYDMVNRDLYEFGEYGYGKNYVKLLHVRRDGPVHTVREYEVSTSLRLSSRKDYLQGDNRDIIATDSQRNTVYVLARRHGVQTPEQFATLLCQHFLYQYPWVAGVSASCDELEWQRLSADGRPHNHAFVHRPQCSRYSRVEQQRNGPPQVWGGLKDLRVLKTTQSAFTDFVQDGYRTLPDANDRIFSTVVQARWLFSHQQLGGVDFDVVAQQVESCILDKFAGPPDTGIFSPSVQNTLYLAEKMVLDKVPSIRSIEMFMPNKHYLPVDMSQFPSTLLEDVRAATSNGEVYHPVDKPSGMIYAQLVRKKHKL